jgi:hypothetical protein
MEFWIDFKAEQQLPENLVHTDRHSSWFRKEKRQSLPGTFSEIRAMKIKCDSETPSPLL